MKSKTNIIYCGDSKFVLEHDLFDRQIKVDLIYLDPPFFTEKIQKGKVWMPEAMEMSYNDSKQFWASHSEAVWRKAPQWLKDLAVERPAFASYLYYMMERLEWCKSVLKDTGSIYLHCDYRASHYLKMIMDKIFGVENFRNEIVWCYRGGGVPKDSFARKHDIIFFYSKSNNFIFNIQYVPYSESSQKLVKSRDGVSIDGKERNLERGAHMPDWWIDMNSLQTWSPERMGYPTQKPLALLERIIKASSNEGDIVLDPFCGCGTAIVAAETLKRRWIGIDINPDACKLMQKRFKQHNVDVEICWRDNETIEKMNPIEFERWVNEFMEAEKPMPDSGVDGITKNGIPIQTKTFVVGYKYVSQFLSDIEYHPKVPKPIKTGIIVSQKGFDSSAISRVYQIEQNEKIKIKLVTPKDLIPQSQRGE